jgi:CTP synthase (UTP-ammonia lyase)
MNAPLRIGIIGDFDLQKPSHIATNAALQQAAQALAVPIEIAWLPTPRFEADDVASQLDPYDALWGAPGSPYHSMAGALRAIRFAREYDRPFLGT